MIFLDIDGTLTLPGSNEPPASAQEAIKQARAKGHKVVLCSGRNRGMLSPLLAYGFDGLVASSGGYIEYSGQVVYDCPMSTAQRDKAMRVFQESDVFRTVECKEGSYTDEGFKDFLRESVGGNSEMLRWREQLENGLGICMANGSADLKKIADEVCPAVDEGGLYKAFVQHGLIDP